MGNRMANINFIYLPKSKKRPHPLLASCVFQCKNSVNGSRYIKKDTMTVMTVAVYDTESGSIDT